MKQSRVFPGLYIRNDLTRAFPGGVKGRRMDFMKRLVCILAVLALLLGCAPALAEGAKIYASWMPAEARDFFSKSAFSGYTIGESASYLLENTVGGNYFFAVAQKDGYNALYGFRETNGKYDYWLRTDSAIPQGKGDFVVRFFSGELHLLSDQVLAFGEGLSIMFIKAGNEEQPDSQLFFSVNKNGQFDLKLLCFDFCWNEALVSADSIAYYHEGEYLGAAFGTVETNLRYFSLSAFPKSVEEARESLSNPPSIPTGDLTAQRIKFTGGQKFEVYSGPGTEYERAANGKASVSTNDWIQVFGTDNGYILIQYDISSTQMRFGYITQTALPKNASAQPLRLEFADAEITAATFLTDDPLNSQTRVRNLSAGQSGVKWLATMGAWVYVEVTGAGRPVRGFVPAGVIRRRADSNTYSGAYNGPDYTAQASVTLSQGSAAATVTVYGPAAWYSQANADKIVEYRMFANNVPLNAQTNEDLWFASSSWIAVFSLQAALPEQTTVLGLCPVHAESGMKAEETIAIALGKAWNAAPAVPPAAAGYQNGYATAVVNNPNPSDRLHLRKSAYGSAPSLGKYYNGTVVLVLPDTNAGEEWAHVRVGDTEGYMQAKYLAFSGAAQVPSAQPTVTVSNASGTGLNLRAGQDTDSPVIRLLGNGTSVTVLGLSEDWLHVQAGSETGYIRASGVTPRLSYTYGSDAIVGKARINADCSGYKKPIEPGDYVGDAGDPNGLIVNTYSAGSVVTVYQIRGGYAQVGSWSGPWVSTAVLTMMD